MKGINRAYVRSGARAIGKGDIQEVVGRAKEIRGRVRHGALRQILRDVGLLLNLVRDYWKGRYRKIPWWALSAVVFALLYIVNPLDLVPDVIPIVGQLDDLAVVTICLAMVGRELEKYQEWREAQAEPPLKE